MYIVGLTGGIGSGKTAVSDRFAAKGITIVDADICARVVVEPGKPALDEIVKHFGENILLENGGLDRATLRQKIFANPDEKQWLESLLHPLIAEELMRQLQDASSDYVILVSPLLIESQQNMICDRVLLVDVPESLQMQRTMQRDDNDEDQVRKIMETQFSRQQRIEKADDIIENIHGLDYLDEQVEKLHQEYLARAREKSEASS